LTLLQGNVGGDWMDEMDSVDGMDEGMAALGGEGTAGFQTGCIADVPIGGARKSGARSSGGRHAGLETRDTAGLETCGTATGQSDRFFTEVMSGCDLGQMPMPFFLR
jgi:hypothetical protein